MKLDQNLTYYNKFMKLHIGGMEKKEGWKILNIQKNDGKFYVSVPDMDILCKIFLDPKPPIGIKYEVLRMIFGGQMDEFDFHYFGWNMSFIEFFFKETGFKKIERVKSFSLFNDTSEFSFHGVPISLNVISYK